MTTGPSAMTVLMALKEGDVGLGLLQKPAAHRADIAAFLPVNDPILDS
jgi:hypothetical protein